VNDGIAAVSIVSGWVPIAVDAAAIALLVAVLCAVLIRRGQVRPLLTTLLGAAGGAAVGLFLCWLLSDQLDLFEVSLSPVSAPSVRGTAQKAPGRRGKTRNRTTASGNE